MLTTVPFVRHEMRPFALCTSDRDVGCNISNCPQPVYDGCNEMYRGPCVQ